MTAPLRRPLVLAGVVLLTATLVAALLLAGGGAGPAEALAQAADETAAVRSGVARASTVVAGGPAVDVTVRFDGQDAEVAFDEVGADGAVTPRVIRVVDGVGYSREGDGWAVLEGGTSDVSDVVRSDIADKELFETVRTASGVTQEGDVFRARLSAEQAAGLSSGLLGLGGAPLAEGVSVEVEAGSDGLIRRIAVDSGDVQRTITYSQLGEPQPIDAPPAG